MNKKSKMKLPIKGSISTAIILLSLMSAANAALFPRLGGQAVYDDDLDITWIADANLAASYRPDILNIEPDDPNPGTNWELSQFMIDEMNADGTKGYLGFNDWRLPVCDSTDCSNSEFEHLFNTEGITIGSPGLFSNIQQYYWTGTGDAASASYAWTGGPSGGVGSYFKTNTGLFPWPVRSGDVSSAGACGVSFDLPNNQWRQISLPCDPGANNKVSDVFANISGTYGTHWALYRYDTTTNVYVDVGIAGTLEQGVGYWIIQKSGGGITLTMPQGSTHTPTTSCASSRGCFEIPLATKHGQNQWNMVGYPFGNYGSLSALTAVSVATSGVDNLGGYNTPCSKGGGFGGPDGDGCTMSESEQVGITEERLWTYNGSTYAEVKGSDTLNPWTAYWLATLSPRAANEGPVELVIPRPTPALPAP